MGSAYCLSIVASNDYVQFASALAVHNADFSCSFWFKLPATGMSLALLGESNDGFAPQVFLGQISPSPSMVPGTTVAANTWYHYVTTYNSSTHTLIGYLNTAADSTNSSVTFPAFGTWYLGTTAPGSGGGNEKICGLRFFGSVLSGLDIAALFATTPTVAVPTHHFNFLQGPSGSILTDVAGSANGRISIATVGGQVNGWSLDNPSTSPDPFAVQPVMTLANGTIHPGGSTLVTFTWLQGSAPGSSVTITPTTALGTFSPTTLTGTTSGSWSATATLTIPGGTTPQPGTITATSSLASSPTTQGFTVANSKIEIITPLVSVLGDLLRVNAVLASNGTTPEAVTGIGAAGATLTVNSGTPIVLGDWFFDGVNNYAICPLVGNHIEIQHAEVAATSGAGWASTAGVLDYDGNLLWWNNAAGHAVAFYTGGATDTMTFTFTVTPNTYYDIDALLDHLTTALTQAGFTMLAARTTIARYTILDNATPVTHFDIDQTKIGFWDSILYPASYRTLDQQLHWSGISTAPVSITSGTLKVVISNQAGSGQLFVNAIRIQQAAIPVASFGDTVVLNAPDSLIVTALDSSPPITNLAVTVDNPANLPLGTSPWFPFSPTSSSRMRLGYNLDLQQCTYPANAFANRARGAVSWALANPGGGHSFTTDPITGELAGMTSGTDAYIAVAAGTSNTSPYVDNWGFPNMPVSGNWIVTYTAVGSPTVQFKSTNTGGTTITGSPVTGTGSQTLTQGVAIIPKLAAYTPELELHVTANSNGDYIHSITVLDPQQPLGWSKSASYAADQRLTGRGFESLRWMTPLGTNGSNVAEFADMGAQTPARQNFVYSVVVASIAPVDTSMTDADHAMAYFTGAVRQFLSVTKVTITHYSWLTPAVVGTVTVSGGAVTSIPLSSGGSGYQLPNECLVPFGNPPFTQSTVTFTPQVKIFGGGGAGAAAHAVVNSSGVITAINITNPGTGYATAPTVVIASYPFHDGQALAVSWGGSTNYPDTGGGGLVGTTYSNGDTASQQLYVTGANTFIMTSFSQTHPATGTFVTLSGSHSLGGTNVATVTVQGAIQVGWAISASNDVMVNPWINIPPLASDDCVSQIGTQIATGMASGLKLYLEYYNEPWNQRVFEFAVMQDQALFFTSQGGNLYGQGSAGWYVKRAHEVYSLVKAAFIAAGRPASDIRLVLGSQHGVSGLITQYMGYASSVSPSIIPDIYAVAVAPYIDNVTANANGYLGGATATAAISGGAPVVTVTSGGFGYLTVPSVTITGDGSGATATATLTAGVVTSIAVTGGSGYTTAAVAIDAPSDLAANRLGPGGQMEMFTHNLLNTGFQSAITADVGALASYPTVKLIGYEGGFQRVGMGTDNTRATEIGAAACRHPLAYYGTLAMLQMCETGGMWEFNQFTMDGRGQQQFRYCWNAFDNNEQLLGTGNLSENPNPSNLRLALSQRGGAALAWVTSVTPVPTPIPTMLPATSIGFFTRAIFV